MKTTRREFLATAAAGPILLGMQDKAGSKAPVLGSGAFTYEAVHDWGALPSSIKWGNTHGVVEDAQRNIYIHHTVHASSERADTMVVFDETIYRLTPLLYGLVDTFMPGPRSARLRELQAAGRPIVYDGPSSDEAIAAAYAECAFTVYPSLSGSIAEVARQLHTRKTGVEV